VSLLSNTQLDSMRSTVDSALPDTAVITRKVRTDDGAGGATNAWTAVGTVACRLSPLSGDEALLGGRVHGKESNVVTMPYSADLREVDRVTISGAVYEVSSVHSPRSWELSTTAMVEQLVAGGTV